MAYIKVPSWIELVKLVMRSPKCSISKAFKELQEHSFWKEQALRFGFNIREVFGQSPLDILWQSFFFERFFEYTLRHAKYNLQNLKSWEKSFWKRNGIFLERLELSSISQQDLELALEWFPNLKTLTLKRCNTLLQAKPRIQLEARLLKLHTLEIQDAHILTEKAFAYIPASLQTLIINQAKSITDEFFQTLEEQKQLRSLKLQNCQSLKTHHLCKLSASLEELDLSGSGKHILPETSLFLPQSLKCLKMNGWDHFGDNELISLPRHLYTLEIEGWQVGKDGLQFLSNLPLTSLNLSRIPGCDLASSLPYLPRSLNRLNLSQNSFRASELKCLSELSSLAELDLGFCLAFDSQFDDAPLIFPNSLTSLNLAYCGPLHKQTIHGLKNLKKCKTLSLAGCMVENSDLEWLPPSIEALDLALCTKVTDVGLILLASQNVLHTLFLDGCEQIRGFGLSHLCSTMKKLTLAGCHRLSGKSLQSLPRSLEELSLDSCELIAPCDIHALPGTLQVLNLSRCREINNDSLDYLSCLPHLNTICLQGCPQITEVAVEKLMRRKFEGTIIIDADCLARKESSDIELHPPVSMLKKLTNFKARLIHKLGDCV